MNDKFENIKIEFIGISPEQQMQTIRICEYLKIADKLENKSLLSLVMLSDDSQKDEFNVTKSRKETVIQGNTISSIWYGLIEVEKNNTADFRKHYISHLSQRSVLIDCGRKYYTLDFFEKLLETMFLNKFNTLQLHFSDNEGFRIESDKHSEIVSKHFLTKIEVKKIINIAKCFGIKIIPELDSPGHLKKILEKHPEHILKGDKDGNKLNIASSESINWFEELLLEYFALFKDSDYFHLGGDEFIDIDQVSSYPELIGEAKRRFGSESSGIDLYIDYINKICIFTEEHGFVPRVWSDGLYKSNYPRNIVALNKNIEVTYWTRWEKHMAPIKRFIEEGHNIVNFNDKYFYYVLGEAASYKYPTVEKMKHWKINEFPEDQYLNKEDMKNVLGVSFNVWADIPNAQNELDIYQSIEKLLPVITEKVWSRQD